MSLFFGGGSVFLALDDTDGQIERERYWLARFRRALECSPVPNIPGTDRASNPVLYDYTQSAVKSGGNTDRASVGVAGEEQSSLTEPATLTDYFLRGSSVLDRLMAKGSAVAVAAELVDVARENPSCLEPKVWPETPRTRGCHLGRGDISMADDLSTGSTKHGPLSTDMNYIFCGMGHTGKTSLAASVVDGRRTSHHEGVLGSMPTWKSGKRGDSEGDEACPFRKLLDISGRRPVSDVLRQVEILKELLAPRMGRVPRNAPPYRVPIVVPGHAGDAGDAMDLLKRWEIVNGNLALQERCIFSLFGGGSEKNCLADVDYVTETENRDKNGELRRATILLPEFEQLPESYSALASVAINSDGHATVLFLLAVPKHAPAVAPKTDGRSGKALEVREKNQECFYLGWMPSIVMAVVVDDASRVRNWLSFLGCVSLVHVGLRLFTGVWATIWRAFTRFRHLARLLELDSGASCHRSKLACDRGTTARAVRGKSSRCSSSMLGFIAAAGFAPGASAAKTIGECLELTVSAFGSWLCQAHWSVLVLIVTLGAVSIYRNIVFSIREIKAGNAELSTAFREWLQDKQSAIDRGDRHAPARRASHAQSLGWR